MSITSSTSPETTNLVGAIQGAIRQWIADGRALVALARRANISVTTLNKVRHWPAAPFAWGAENTSLQLDHVVRLASALSLEVVARETKARTKP